MKFVQPDKDSNTSIIENKFWSNRGIGLNAELEQKHGSIKTRITSGDLTNTKMPDSAERWCKENGVTMPSKTYIAYRLLDQITDRNILDSSRAIKLKNLANRIQSRLGIT